LAEEREIFRKNIGLILNIFHFLSSTGPADDDDDDDDDATYVCTAPAQKKANDAAPNRISTGGPTRPRKSPALFGGTYRPAVCFPPPPLALPLAVLLGIAAAVVVVPPIFAKITSARP
jgi:hypothetical protein